MNFCSLNLLIYSITLNLFSAWATSSVITPLCFGLLEYGYIPRFVEQFIDLLRKDFASIDRYLPISLFLKGHFAILGVLEVSVEFTLC